MLSPIPEILEDLRQGKLVILVDDEDRENEGDLVCAAEHVTPEIDQLHDAPHPRLPLRAPSPPTDCDRLELHPQTVANTALRGTAMAVSVDGHPRHGVGTGISASDRARTARLLADPDDPARRPGAARATWCRCAPATAACSCARARRRARWTSCGSPDSTRPR